MSEPIDGLYFNWLRAKVVSYEAPSYMHLDLLKTLYATEFVWLLIGDKNRIEDGLELRIDFLRESGVEREQEWWDSPCSVFEVLVALAKRACFITDTPVDEWFWRFITNLGLYDYRDRISRVERILIDRILETWILRLYDSSGYGGLFPMREPNEDQTKLEIYYQMNRYFDDQGL